MRIDPLDEDGNFDSDFFQSDEYYSIEARALEYAKTIENTITSSCFVFSVYEHDWLVSRSQFTN